MSRVCAGCSAVITDRVMLSVSRCLYHSACLRCYVCNRSLVQEDICYSRLGDLYCINHYYKLFGRRCNGCMRAVLPTDWIRKVDADTVYHLSCFHCEVCKRQLSTGESYGFSCRAVYCLTHHIQLSEDNSEQAQSSTSKCRKKRIRTSFSEHHLDVLQKTFHMESNPDTAELERLVSITSLSKRVIQVWFQNARARHKKFTASNFSPSTMNSDLNSSVENSACHQQYLNSSCCGWKQDGAV